MTEAMHSFLHLSATIAFLTIPIILFFFLRKSKHMFQQLHKRTEEVAEIKQLLTGEIDSHKKTIEKLQYLKAILESSSDAIIATTIDGDIMNWNLGATQIFGYTSAEMIDKSYFTLIPHHQIAGIIQIFRKAREGQRLVQPEIDHLHKNGSVIVGSLTVSPIRYDNGRNEIAGISIIVRDKTAKKKLEDEMKRLTQIKTVSEIAASISHEVRNPLTVTRGFTQLLKDSNLTEEQRHQYIKLSLEELDRAERIISDYLTYAKPTIENVTLLNVMQEVEYIVQVINPYAVLNNITVKMNVEENNLHIVGEKQKLHQSLLNIIKNGVEAMEGGGEITVTITKRKGEVLLIIKDNGKGMTEEQVKRIGTPYYSTKSKGTGLGTMVAFTIIKDMQGDYQIESEIGKGTSFYITFPLVNSKIRELV